jgi:hypothetical protein
VCEGAMKLLLRDIFLSLFLNNKTSNFGFFLSTQEKKSSSAHLPERETAKETRKESKKC